MATFAHSAPLGVSVLTAPFRLVMDAVEMLHAAQRAAHMADKLYNQTDSALKARGLKRADVSACILAELDRR